VVSTVHLALKLSQKKLGFCINLRLKDEEQESKDHIPCEEYGEELGRAALTWD
jgi:hypothetical protein